MRGGPTRRVFGVRSWLALEAIDVLLRLVHPILREEIREALKTAAVEAAYPVPKPSPDQPVTATYTDWPDGTRTLDEVHARGVDVHLEEMDTGSWALILTRGVRWWHVSLGVGPIDDHATDFNPAAHGLTVWGFMEENR